MWGELWAAWEVEQQDEGNDAEALESNQRRRRWSAPSVVGMALLHSPSDETLRGEGAHSLGQWGMEAEWKSAEAGLEWWWGKAPEAEKRTRERV